MDLRQDSKVTCLTFNRKSKALDTFGILKKLYANTFPINAAIDPVTVFSVVNLSMQ